MSPLMFNRLFIHSFLHSFPSSLLATTGNMTLCWSLRESASAGAPSQPFGSSQLGKGDERRGANKNTTWLKILQVRRTVRKLVRLRRVPWRSSWRRWHLTCLRAELWTECRS